MGRRGRCLQPTLVFAKLEAQFASFTCQPRGQGTGRAWVRVREFERVIGTGFRHWTTGGKGPHRTGGCGMVGFGDGMDPMSGMERMLVV